MKWTDWLTLGIAVLGAVLGVISTWTNLSRSRASVEAAGVWRFLTPDSEGALRETYSRRIVAMAEKPEGALGVEVVNSGYVAVHVGEVGFCSAPVRRFGRRRETIRYAVLYSRDEVFGPFGQLPPGAAALIRATPRAHDLPDVRQMTHVYVKAQDGRTFYGALPFFGQLADQ
jgi:hypothetical protein